MDVVYAILSFWKDFVFMVYWPLWIVPVFLFIRKKYLKNKWLFLLGSIGFCFVANYLIEYFLTEMFFNSSNAEIDKFAFDNLEVISNLIFLLQIFVPMSLVHFLSKLNFFKKTDREVEKSQEATRDELNKDSFEDGQNEQPRPTGSGEEQ